MKCLNHIEMESLLVSGQNLALTKHELDRFNAYLERNDIKLGYNTISHEDLIIISKR